MTTASLPSGIELEYDTFGSHDEPALLLVMGFTAQMIAWDERFCRRLADAGRFVIRFDNRDCGLSSKLTGDIDVGAAMMAVLAGTELPEVPYTLSDMAADAIGLLDHLGIESAHAVGASMGGMIVQTMAIEHPERLLSVTSVMSMVGDPEYGMATPEALHVLLTPPPPDRAGVIARGRPTTRSGPRSGTSTSTAPASSQPCRTTARTFPMVPPASSRPCSPAATVPTR